jgi:hypothetical protein
MNSDALKLKHACFAGDLDEVRRLLDSGADPNATDEHGSGTLLTFHPAMIAYLLSRGADPNTQTNENGSSVLAGLAYVNELECVRILLRAGADPNRGRDVSGETPLHHALAGSERGRTPLVKLLLDYGADPNSRTKPGVPSYNFWRDARTPGETPLHRPPPFRPARLSNFCWHLVRIARSEMSTAIRRWDGRVGTCETDQSLICSTPRRMDTTRPDHALRRTRPSRYGCNRTPSCQVAELASLKVLMVRRQLGEFLGPHSEPGSSPIATASATPK